MSLLTRAAILDSRDIPTQDVEVPEWGGTVRVRAMSFSERAELIRRKQAGENHDATGAWLVAQLVVDEQGGKLFTEDDVVALSGKQWRAVDRVVTAILEVNRLDEARVEEAAKN